MARTIRKALVLSAIIMVGLTGSLSTAADNYPHKTVTLATHSSPGGGSDVFLRQLSGYIAPELGVNVVVENIRGGSGAKAMAALAQAPADGSIFYATTPTFIYTSLLSSPEYKYTDLEPLVNMFIDPEVIYTAANSPYMTLDDVIKEAREGRGKWGAANPASLERQALEQLKTAADVKAAIVTHEGGGDLMINVLNGTLHIGVGEVQELQSQLEAKQLRILATFSGARLENFPDIPTVKELGYDVVVQKFRGLAGPKGLPANVVAMWEKAVQAVLANPEYKAAYQGANLRAEYMAHDDYVAFISDFGSKTENFLRETGVIK